MRVGITGSSGLLGSTLVSELKNSNIDVFAIARSAFALDVSSDELAQYLEGNAIELVIHSAANTNVEQCERAPEECYADNLLRTELLAKACRRQGVKFVFISSTGIYGAAKHEPYYEFDNVVPTTHHHNSKYLAEGVVEKLIPEALIVRTGWLFGGDLQAPKNFVLNRYKEALAAKDSIHSDISQRGCPTYVKDVAKQLLVLIKNDASGVFNCVNEGIASRYDYVSKIIEYFELDVTVEPVDGSVFNRLAKVSHNETAVNYKLNQYGYNVMRPWDVALGEYIALLKGSIL